MCPIGVSVAMKQETVELVDTVVRFHVISCTWSPLCRGVTYYNMPIYSANRVLTPCLAGLFRRAARQVCSARLFVK